MSDWTLLSGVSHRSSFEPNLHLQRFNIPATHNKKKRFMYTPLYKTGWQCPEFLPSELHTIKTESFLFTWMQLVHWWVKFWFEDLQYTRINTKSVVISQPPFVSFYMFMPVALSKLNKIYIKSLLLQVIVKLKCTKQWHCMF